MKCKICASVMDAEIYEVREMMYGFRDVHKYFQCPDCQCLQIVDFPENLQKYYADDYYSYQVAGPRTFVKNWAVRLRDRYALFGTGLVGKWIHARHPTAQFNFLKPLIASIDLNWRVLDVGCGSGQLLLGLQGIGFTSLTGADPFIADNINYGNGVIVWKASINDLNGEFDVIMFHHSLEHMPDQLETLQKAFTLLNPGGHCIIRIPTVSSFAWKQYGVDWVQLDAPRHFFLHSVESIKVLCDAVGFVLDEVVYDSKSFQFWGSEQYRNDIPLKDSRSYAVDSGSSLFPGSIIADYEKKSVELNAAMQGDQAVFYLRKPL